MDKHLQFIYVGIITLTILTISCSNQTSKERKNVVENSDVNDIDKTPTDTTFSVDTNLVFHSIDEIQMYVQAKLEYLKRNFSNYAKEKSLNQDSLKFWKDSIFYSNAYNLDLMRLKFMEKNSGDEIFFFYLMSLSEKDRLSKDRLISVYNKFPETLRKGELGKKIREKLYSEYRIDNLFTLTSKLSLYNTNNQPAIIPQKEKYNYTLVIFWASWCSPCRYENRVFMKKLNEIDTSKIRIIGLSVDDSYNNWVRALNVEKYPWENFSNLRGFESDLIKQFKINSIPYHIGFDKAGNVIKGDQDIFKVLEKLK